MSVQYINNNLHIGANFSHYLFVCGRDTDNGCGREVASCTELEIQKLGK